MTPIDPAIAAAIKSSAAVVGLGIFSTLHTYLDKHPRSQALAQLAHALTTVNIPALRSAWVFLCRAVVDHADGEDVKALKDLSNAYTVAKPVIVARPEDDPALAALPKVAPPPIPAGTVKSWSGQ